MLPMTPADHEAAAAMYRSTAEPQAFHLSAADVPVIDGGSGATVRVVVGVASRPRSEPTGAPARHPVS
ncbi:unannotated protein [freshwater metagenome]|uniref:Unannotated protein n=1 Tax=freshwater metagenome TaxID=449393 RepID=A0A6J6D4X7_9ZZZZ